MKLKPLPTKEELADRPRGWDNPIVQCAMCGIGKQSHLMFHITIGLPVAGHPDINTVFCQHWGCEKHWQEIAHACIDEHITQQHDGAMQAIMQAERGNT